MYVGDVNPEQRFAMLVHSRRSGVISLTPGFDWQKWCGIASQTSEIDYHVRLVVWPVMSKTV